MIDLLRLLIFLTGALFLRPIYAQSIAPSESFEIFNREVYPILSKRCSECHAFTQSPYHSSLDPEEAFNEAKKVIMLDFPDQSPLWIRSYNSHCGRPLLCGEADPQFQAALTKWIGAEKISQSSHSLYRKAGEITVSLGTLTQNKKLRIPGGIYFGNLEFNVVDLGNGVVMLNDIFINSIPSNLTLEGFEVRSDYFMTSKQNFSDQKWVIKKDNLASLRLNQNRSSSTDYIIMESASTSPPPSQVTFSIWLKNPSQNLSLEEQNQLFENRNYQALYDQKINDTIGGFFRLPSERQVCAWFREGYVRCWGSGVSTLPHDPRVKILKRDFSAYGGIAHHFPNETHEGCYLTNDGQLFCRSSEGGLLALIEKFDVRENVSNVFFTPGIVCVQHGEKAITLTCREARQKNPLTPYRYFSANTGNTSGLNKIETIYLTKRSIPSVYIFNDGVAKVIDSSQRMKSIEAGKTDFIRDAPRLKTGRKVGISGISERFFFEVRDRPPPKGPGSSDIYKADGRIVMFKDGKVKFWLLYKNIPKSLESARAEYDRELSGLDEFDQLKDAPTFDFGFNEPIVKAAVNGNFACLLTESGRLKCIDIPAALGFTPYPIKDEKIRLEYYPHNKGYLNFENQLVVDITNFGGIDNNFCALLENGKIKCWGHYSPSKLDYGRKLFAVNPDYETANPQLEIGPHDPLASIDLGDVFATSLYLGPGRNMICATLKNGSAKCWGVNISGDLGVGSHYSHVPQYPLSMGENLPFIEASEKARYLPKNEGHEER